MSLRSKSFSLSGFFYGSIVAALALLSLFILNLGLYGAASYEWGFWLSFGISLVAIQIAYVLGTVLVGLVAKLFGEGGFNSRASLVLLGFATSLLLYSLTEVSLLSDIMGKYLPWYLILVIGVVISSAISIAMGFLMRRRTATGKLKHQEQ